MGESFLIEETSVEYHFLNDHLFMIKRGFSKTYGDGRQEPITTCDTF